jgi:hypothetical protein
VIETPIVEEVRRRASELSARYDDDLLEMYVDHLREVQARYADRLVDQIRIVRAGAATETANR